MSIFPRYLSEYPNRYSSLPFHMYMMHARTVTPHRHDFLELTLVLDGYGVENINGVKHALKKGTMIFLLPYQIHEIHPVLDSSLRAYVCNFDLRLTGGPNEEEGILHAPYEAQGQPPYPFVQLDVEQFRLLEPIFDTLLREYQSRETARNILIRAKLLEALALFDRIRSSTLPRPADPAPVTFRRSIWDVVQYIHDNYRSEITLEELAKNFHFSASHLSELFKKHLGRNYIDFLHEVRVRNACSLLESTDLAISEVAVEAGFGSFTSFYRVFKKQKGIAPSEYKAKSEQEMHPRPDS